MRMTMWCQQILSFPPPSQLKDRLPAKELSRSRLHETIKTQQRSWSRAQELCSWNCDWAPFFTSWFAITVSFRAFYDVKLCKRSDGANGYVFITGLSANLFVFPRRFAQIPAKWFGKFVGKQWKSGRACLAWRMHEAFKTIWIMNRIRCWMIKTENAAKFESLAKCRQLFRSQRF